MKKLIKENLEIHRGIFNNFGEAIQLDKLEEECAEFITQLIKYKATGHIRDLIELKKEIADLHNITTQFMAIDPKVRQYSTDKLGRTIDRIKAGYY